MAVDNRPTLSRSERRWRTMTVLVFIPALCVGLWALAVLSP